MIDLRHGIEWRLVAFYVVAIGLSVTFEVWLGLLLWRLFT